MLPRGNDSCILLLVFQIATLALHFGHDCLLQRRGLANERAGVLGDLLLVVGFKRDHLVMQPLHGDWPMPGALRLTVGVPL